MKNLKVSEAVKTKLHEKHQVTLREVEHCFENIEGRLLYDDRVWTKTHPPHLGSLRQPTQTVCSKSCIYKSEIKWCSKQLTSPTHKSWRSMSVLARSHEAILQHRRTA